MFLTSPSPRNHSEKTQAESNFDDSENFEEQKFLTMVDEKPESFITLQESNEIEVPKQERKTMKDYDELI